MVNIHYFISFLRFGNLGAALLGGCNSESLTRLHHGVDCLAWRHLQALVEENLLPSLLTWLLVDVRRSTKAYSHGLLHGLPHNMAGGFPWSEQERARERTQDGSQSSYYLISEVTSHHFCHHLFIRRESLISAHTQGEKN